jgi:protein ImuB
LGKKPLAGQVYEVHFVSADCVPYQPMNASLLPGAAEAAQQLSAVIETLVARLGPESVVRIAAKPEHRPELATELSPLRTATPNTAATTKPRPLWLLPEPRALVAQLDDRPAWHGQLMFLAGPERIETGWWDGAPMRRDYFVARNPHGETVWIYQNLHDRCWFLHGLFA